MLVEAPAQGVDTVLAEKQFFLKHHTGDTPAAGRFQPRLVALDFLKVVTAFDGLVHRLQVQPHILGGLGQVIAQVPVFCSPEQQRGHLGGAGLDVFEREPAVNPDLLGLPTVILLPHMGSATVEGRIEMGEKVIINIKTFLDGHAPPDRVFPAMF